MIKSIRVMLIPNNKQTTRLFQYARASRFAYNWALNREQENHKNGGKFISDNDLRKEFTVLRHTDEYSWLSQISNNVTKQAIKDACGAYYKFFKGQSRFPKYKTRKKSKPSFFQDPLKIKFTDKYVKVEGFATSRKSNRQKLNYIRLAERGRIPVGCKYYNPRITFDGINWWVSVGVTVEDKHPTLTDSGIGIDLGIKDLAICSDGNVYRNINKSSVVKKLESKQRRLQRSISRCYDKNKKGGRYCKTNNTVKKEKLLLKVTHRLANTRNNYLHQITTEIVNRKPRFICIEDLNAGGMMKNKHLAKSIQSQGFYEFRRQLEYKCLDNGIELVIADRLYPSSKLCSCCGNIKKDLKLSDRVYRCACGNIIDRDYQAALNLMTFGNLHFST